MNRAVGTLAVIGILTVVFLAACSGGSGTTSQAEPRTPTTASQTSLSGPTGLAPGEQPTTAGPSSQIPVDLPIMEGAYNLKVARAGTQVTFTIDQDIPTVVDFYQSQLEAKGWQMTRSPDTVMGAMAALSRVNETGETITVNLQFNPNSQFTVVIIAIVRSR